MYVCRLYACSTEDVDLSSLLTLRSVCGKMTDAVDEHFRLIYMRRSAEVLISFSPYFMVAWQNVFESAEELITDLSELGMTLLTVRNTEGTASQ